MPAAVPLIVPDITPVASCVYLPVIESNPATPLSPTLMVAAVPLALPTERLPFTVPAPRIVPPVTIAPAIPARVPLIVVLPTVWL